MLAAAHQHGVTDPFGRYSHPKPSKLWCQFSRATQSPGVSSHARHAPASVLGPCPGTFLLSQGGQAIWTSGPLVDPPEVGGSTGSSATTRGRPPTINRRRRPDKIGRGRLDLGQNNDRISGGPTPRGDRDRPAGAAGRWLVGSRAVGLGSFRRGLARSGGVAGEGRRAGPATSGRPGRQVDPREPAAVGSIRRSGDWGRKLENLLRLRQMGSFGRLDKASRAGAGRGGDGSGQK